MSSSRLLCRRMDATLHRPLVGVASSSPVSTPVANSFREHAVVEPYKRPRSTHRLIAIDLLRGLIMIVMSWDHARDFLSQHKVGQHGSERWSGLLSDYDNNLLVFFQRWVTHFCAPGFFFTMGFSMFMMTSSRIKKHSWSSVDVVGHFLKRGLILIVVGRIVDLAIVPELIPVYAKNQTLFPTHSHGVNTTSHGGSSSSPFRGPLWLAPLIGIWEVMTALGNTMILLGLALPLLLYIEHKVKTSSQLASIILGIAFVIASNHFILNAQGNDPCGVECQHKHGDVEFPRFDAVAIGWSEIFLRFLLYPGSFAFGVILYPVIPWISISLFGYAFGPLFREHAEHAYMWCGLVGSTCLVLFFVLRIWGGAAAGNLRGWPRGEGSTNSFIAFLTVCKYPPSISYMLLTLGLDLTLLWALQRVLVRKEMFGFRASISSVLLVFGQTPLFFYTIHFWTLGCIGFIMRWFALGFPIEYVSLPWLFMLVLLFFICRRYRTFKKSKPMNSFWKLI